MKKGYFLTFEGIDGAGKTTLGHLVKQELERQGWRVVPVDHKKLEYDRTTFLGKKLYSLQSAIWGHVENEALGQLPTMCWIYMLATWYILVSKHFVEPLRGSGEIVIADSWMYKRIARFSLKKDIDIDHLMRCFTNISAPDVTFLMDVSPNETWKRRKSYPPKDLGVFDGFTSPPAKSYFVYQQAIREKLQEYAKEGGWVVLDASQELQNLQKKVLQVLNVEG